jgi:ankyrin repeat protein
MGNNKSIINNTDKTELEIFMEALLLSAGDLVKLNRMLQDNDIDPSVGNNHAIQWAAYNGHLAVVEGLLQDPRVDPSAQNNYAIRLASRNGHLAIVNLLLEDPRVDPSERENDAIQGASHNGHLAIVTRLLQDERVDPTLAFRKALAKSKSNIPLITCFMHDKRINLSFHLKHVVICSGISKSLIILDMILQDDRINLLRLHNIPSFNNSIENVQFKKLSYATRLLICGKLLLKDFPKNSTINHWKKDMQKCKDELAECRKTMHLSYHLDNEIFDEYILRYLCNNNSHHLEI